jgi:hypothetical protein
MFKLPKPMEIYRLKRKQTLNMKGHHFRFLPDVRTFYCRKIVEVAMLLIVPRLIYIIAANVGE